jgi:crotonobetainyl-CoA:carnitine CoA-transferase CaiB-like acyl-CoA transferase
VKPLENLRVVDATSGPIGGLATMVLADFGAEVVKIEPRTGDAARALAHARVWLRGKRSTVCDDDELIELIANTADAVVTDRALDADRLRGDRPDLVYGAIVPFDGLPLDEALVAARLGRMMVFRGVVDRDGPVYSAVQVATHATSQAVAAGIAAGLYARERTGQGCYFETTLAHGLLPYEMGGLFVPQLQKRGIELPPLGGDPFTLMPTINYHPVQCADGRWLQLGNLLPHLLERFLRCIGLDDVLAAHGNQPMQWPDDVREAFRDRMLRHMQTRTAAQWMELFLADGGVVAHPYQTTQQALDDPDLVMNGHVAATPLGRQPGVVARLDATPGSVGISIPAIGEFDLSIALQRRVRAPEPSASPRRPLEGVTVVEFATIIAAPLGSSMLADLGARVIKVEPLDGDPFRAMMGGVGAARVNAGKESICIDLKSEDGRRIAWRLIENADVLVHNYRVGVPERLGIGYDDARKVNPRIVYVTVNGYGPEGPGALRPSTHPIPGAALGGVILQLGGHLPVELLDGAALRDAVRRLSRANELNPDPNTSMVVVTAATLGLAAVARCGVGQAVYVDMFGANAYANFDDFFDFPGRPARVNPDADGFGLSDRYRLYECADGWVFLSVAAKDQNAFETVVAQLSERAGKLDAVFKRHAADWWVATLRARGLACVRADAGLPAERISAEGLVVDATSSTWGTYQRHAPLLDFASTSPHVGWCAMGEHTRSLLEEFSAGRP